MKKNLCMLIILALLLSLMACGTDTAPENIVSESSIPETEIHEMPAAETAVPETTVPETSVTETETPEMSVLEEEIVEDNEEGVEMMMNVLVGDTVFTATLEENEAVTALVEMMKNAPVVIQMSDYSGFEKVGALGTSLPASNSQTTTQSGDIVLYSGNQIVIFYGSNSWSYTRLGKINDLTGWEEALGNGDVTVTFSLA